MRYKKLEIIFPFIDNVFKKFYQELLSNDAFMDYFSNGHMPIEALLQKQKENFIDSIYESEEDFINRFIVLGRKHFELGIPFEAFLSGSKILNSEFISTVINNKMDSSVILILNNYFSQSSELMAKGYLELFINHDRKHIKSIIISLKENRNISSSVEKKMIVEYYEWLLGLFDAIQKEDDRDVNFKIDNKNLNIIFEKLKFKQNFFDFLNVDEVEKNYRRIFANAKNIFYFIEKGVYTEVLSLFINLLEIYKFILMFSNILTTSVTLEVEQLLQDSQKVLNEDSLTGLYNRRKFDESLNYALEQKKDFSLIMIDVDKFKTINDTYGHDVGDIIIKEVSKVLLKSTSANDLVARFGGDEFAIISLNSRLKEAINLAEIIKTNLKYFSFERDLKITLSIGISELEEGDNCGKVFKRADQNLYQAKQNGRNCFYPTI